MTLRIGLIGAGANTKLKHIPGFQKIDEVDLVTVCNRSRESSERAAAEFGLSTVYDNWLELVQSDDWFFRRNRHLEPHCQERADEARAGDQGLSRTIRQALRVRGTSVRNALCSSFRLFAWKTREEHWSLAEFHDPHLIPQSSF